MTALMHNAKQRDIGCVEALILAKADVNLRSKTGVTALIMAARSGCDPCITLLTDAGANMALKDNRYGLTALMSACKNQQVGCVRNLLSANATVAYVDQKTQPEGVTALAYASGFSCPGCVQLLLDAGADPDNKDNWHKTALMAAARSDCTSCVEKLLEAKATTDIKNDEELPLSMPHVMVTRIVFGYSSKLGLMSISLIGKSTMPYGMPSDGPVALHA
ncbi:unnamed protein product [Meganyctiphanes norvegica]|uniref:Ankyrin repeat domain-containing protein n=1 Tax=Meganyctiphanes norvegica TaxID=48144 RepID=A0AAV2Q4Y6_MEGNR